MFDDQSKSSIFLWKKILCDQFKKLFIKLIFMNILFWWYLTKKVFRSKISIWSCKKIVLQKMKLRLHQKIVNTENSSSVFLMNNKKIRLIFIKNVDQTYVWVFVCYFHDVLWHCIISHYNIFYTCFHHCKLSASDCNSI